MRKLLAVLGSLVFVASSASGVVACDEEGGVMHDLAQVKASDLTGTKYGQILMTDHTSEDKTMLSIYANLSSMLNAYFHQNDKGGISPFTDVNFHVFDVKDGTTSDYGKEYVDTDNAHNAVQLDDNFRSDPTKSYLVDFIANSKSDRAKNSLKTVVMKAVSCVDLSKMESTYKPDLTKLDLTGPKSLEDLSHKLIKDFSEKMKSKINLADDNAFTKDGTTTYNHSDFAMTTFFKEKSKDASGNIVDGDQIKSLADLQKLAKGTAVAVHFNAAVKMAGLISGTSKAVEFTV